MAKYIASELEDQVDQIQMERLEYHGKVMELMRKQETIRKGDLSNFSYNKEIEDLSQYDLILFGSPTYGAIPAPVFNGILQHIKNLEGRDVIIFATCRFYGGKILQMMEHDIEKKGGNIIAKKLFKGFFRILDSM
ncbi:MAG: hypothetical protein P8Y97_09735 [Candidatus Lokiarchaeota archaeon]